MVNTLDVLIIITVLSVTSKLVVTPLLFQLSKAGDALGPQATEAPTAPQSNSVLIALW